jgi:hypothetical protein
VSGSFTETHDRYLDAWQHAFAAGDTEALEAFLAPGYHGSFAASAGEATAFDAAEALAGVRASVEALRGAEQTIASRVVGERPDGSACVFYAKTIVLAERRVGAFVVESWVRDGASGWRLLRESVEHGAALRG